MHLYSSHGTPRLGDPALRPSDQLAQARSLCSLTNSALAPLCSLALELHVPAQ